MEKEKLKAKDAYFLTMLEIELQLPLDTKRVEWNKENPTFGEVKERLWSCGVARNWCVEVLRGKEFFSPDENHMFSAKQLTVRALPISGTLKRPRVSHPKAEGFMKKKVAPEWNNRYEELFVEGVIPYIGRVFVLPKDTGNLRLEDCTGTVGLVGGKGESIGAFHSVRNAWKFPDKFDVYIKYANHDKQPSFPAKIEIYSEELDLFIAMPLPPFQLDFPKYLCPASGVSVGDLVHCLGFPKMIDIQTLSKLGNHAPHAKRTPSPTIKEQLEYPAVFSGKVCFSGWKQVVADYRSFPNSTGAVIVDDNGHLKGIHISTLSATGFNSELCSLDNDEDPVKKTQTLLKKVNSSFPQIVADAQCAAEAAVFVPINILMKSFTPVMDPQTKHILYM